MKVLVQNSLWWPQVIGGAEISSHLLGRELRRRGLRADAVASTGRTTGQDGLRIRPTDDGLGTVFEAPAHGLYDFFPTEEARSGILTRGLNHFAAVHSSRWEKLFGEVLERSQPDIVHTNNLVGLTPAIWSAARRHGIPVIHTIRDYHLLCPRTTLLRSNGADCQNPPLPCRLLARLKRRRTGGLRMVTAPTRFVLDKHLAAGGFPGAQPHVIPNALEEWPAEIPTRRAGGPVRGLFLGQIDTHKGIPELLAALGALLADETCADLQFDFAGRGPLVTEVESFCAANPQRLRYHGQVTGDEKRALLAACGFMVVPSVWAEPFSRSIIDGFSWGMPAIGARRGGIPEVITADRDGLVVEPSAQELARAMRALVLDPHKRLAMGSRARQGASRFTLAAQVDRFIRLYETMAGGSA